MKPSTKYIIGGSIAAVAGLAAWYYSAAQKLVFDIIDPATGLPNIQYKSADADGIHLNLRFAVYNPSILPFLSPSFDFTFTTTAGVIGTAHNLTLQRINGSGTSFIDVDAFIPWGSALGNVVQIVQTQTLPTGINYTGTINMPFYQVPIAGVLT